MLDLRYNVLTIFAYSTRACEVADKCHPYPSYNLLHGALSDDATTFDSDRLSSGRPREGPAVLSVARELMHRVREAIDADFSYCFDRKHNGGRHRD